MDGDEQIASLILILIGYAGTVGDRIRSSESQMLNTHTHLHARTHARTHACTQRIKTV